MGIRNYALIDENWNVVGVIVYDGVSQYTPPSGDMLVMDPNDPPQVAVGWMYLNGVFTPPQEG